MEEEDEQAQRKWRDGTEEWINLRLHNPLSSVTLSPTLKTGYIEFARLELSADAIHAIIVSAAVAMAAEVHCQRPPVRAHAVAVHLHNCEMLLVLPAIPMRHADNMPATGLPRAVADSEPQLPWQPPGWHETMKTFTCGHFTIHHTVTVMSRILLCMLHNVTQVLRSYY